MAVSAWTYLQEPLKLFDGNSQSNRYSYEVQVLVILTEMAGAVRTSERVADGFVEAFLFFILGQAKEIKFKTSEISQVPFLYRQSIPIGELS